MRDALIETTTYELTADPLPTFVPAAPGWHVIEREGTVLPVAGWEHHPNDGPTSAVVFPVVCIPNGGVILHVWTEGRGCQLVPPGYMVEGSAGEGFVVRSGGGS